MSNINEQYNKWKYTLWTLCTLIVCFKFMDDNGKYGDQEFIIRAIVFTLLVRLLMGP